MLNSTNNMDDVYCPDNVDDKSFNINIDKSQSSYKNTNTSSGLGSTSINVDFDEAFSGNQIRDTFIEPAIDVKKVCLKYGSKTPVLHNLCMNVPIGSIYGLLGPSGCGKTSLIRCILGITTVDSGSINVFSKTPASSDSLVPGPAVGYLPQEISLYSILTIQETLEYFGSLYNLPRDEMQKQMEFLIEFLQLPDRKRSVGVLSGGQKRRVSLATALIHKPPLLILDEPTVGIDPLLRKAIWQLLTELSVYNGVTILITTHYIEEAKDATYVGLMRDGAILVQSEPSTLLERYRFRTLEQVFLSICAGEERKKSSQAMNKGSKKISNHQNCIDLMVSNDEAAEAAAAEVEAQAQMEEEFDEPILNYYRRRQYSNSSGVDSQTSTSSATSSVDKHSCKSTSKSRPKVPQQEILSANSLQLTLSKCSSRSSAYGASIAKTKAMLNKNFRSLYRNYGYMLFQFFLPTLEVALFCLCIGLVLHSISVAVYDGDESNLSKRFLTALNGRTINVKKYSSSSDAINSVRNGHSASALIIYKNFSNALHERLAFFGDVEEEVLKNSTIHLYPDMSNQLAVMTINREVLNSFIRVGKNYLRELGFSSNLLDLPIKIESPIYGQRDPSFTEFMAPGVMLSITFLAAIPLTTMNLVVERKDGLIERTLVTGVTHFNILVSHLLCQTLILLVQVTFLMIMVFPIFRIPYHGEFFGIMLLTVAQSFCGMSFGLLVSALSKTENTATMLSLGAFYPMLLLSGTVWPIDAMNDFLKSFAIWLPQTIPIIAMRSMIARGWGITHWEVVQGFLVSFAWIFIFLLASTLIFTFRKK